MTALIFIGIIIGSLLLGAGFIKEYPWLAAIGAISLPILVVWGLVVASQNSRHVSQH